MITPQPTEPFKVIFSKAYQPALVVLLCILVGNQGYYFLRAQWHIGQPAFKDMDILDNEKYLNIMSLTYVMNIIGKFAGGWLIDRSNRPTFGFVTFIILAALATFVTTLLPTYTMLLIFWPVSRLFTTIGKMSVIKMLAIYWPSAVMGTVIGISTVSCSFGESISKAVLSLALGIFDKQDITTGWKKVFYVTIALGITCILPTCLFVRDGKESYNPEDDISLQKGDMDVKIALEKIAEEKKEVKQDGSSDGPTIVAEASRPKLPFVITTVKLLKNPRMLLLCLLMVTISCLREVLGAHSISFMKDVLKLENSANGGLTSAFCAASAIGTLFGGRLIDSIPKRHRSLVNIFYMSAVGVCFLLVALGSMPGIIEFSNPEQRSIFCIGFLMTAEFFIGAPVSYVDGIYLVDLVDRSELSFAAGIVGCIGYLGPLAQNTFFKGWMAPDSEQWHLVYFWGFICACVAVGISSIYWIMDLRRERSKRDVTQ